MAAPVPERMTVLDRECGGDAGLRREVESLLDARTQAFVRTGGAAHALADATTGSAPIVEKPGEKIGPYKLLQLIGEGGFGSVFLAEQSEPVRRKVALKIIKLGMDTRQVIARFEAERQALAMMDHPHIARVLDAGATESGRPYFVMEYVKGDAITQFADAHKLGVHERLELFGHVCAAVQHAHTKGIIHRDLKPGNVLVSMTDGKPFAKVIDFGIAKATGASLTDKTLFTEHRQLIGTPEYMSPEQAEGSPDIDTRTDVYALGVLLYELLTGATPFDAHRLRSAAFAEMQRIIKEEEPLAPSVRVTAFMREPRPSTPSPSSSRASATSLSDGLSLARQLKGELDWIVMKALDKDRARRYESPSQMAEDVRRHLGGEAVVAAPAGVGYRVQKFVRRNKGSVTTVSAVIGALMLGGGLALTQWEKARRANAKLIGQRDKAEAGVGRMMSILMSRAYTGPLVSIGEDGERKGEDDPLGYAIGFGTQLAESLKNDRDKLEAANASLTMQNTKVIESLTQLVHTLNLADPGRNWWWYTFPDGRKVTVVREKKKEWNVGVRILEGHIRDPETSLDRPQPTIEPEFAMQALAMMIEDAAIRMENQIMAADEAAAQLRGLVNQANAGLVTMMNEMSSGDGFNIQVSGGGGDWMEKVPPTATGERKLRMGNASGAVVTMETGRDPSGRSILTNVTAEGPGADAYLLSLLVRNGLTGIRMNKQNEEELERTNQKLAEQVEQAQRQAYRANIGAAATALDAGEPAACRALLDECPDSMRGWEWRVLDTRLDDALVVMDGDRSCRSAQFSPDGERVLWQGSNQTAGVCDARTGRELARVRVPGALEWAQFSPDGTLIETLSLDYGADPGSRLDAMTGVVQFWDSSTGAEVRRIDLRRTRIAGAELSPDRTQLVVLSKSDAGVILPIGSDAPNVVLTDTASGLPRQARFSPDGRLLLLNSFAQPTQVFSTTSGECLMSIGASDSGDARFSPDSTLVVCVQAAGDGTIWNARTGERVSRIASPDGHRGDGFYSCYAALSSDGRLAATTLTGSNALRVWDPVTAQELQRLVHADLVNHASFSPDASILASTDSRNTTYVWEVASGKLRFKLPGEAVLGAWTGDREIRAISPDGSRLVTCSYDGRARVWDLARVPGRVDAPAGEKVIATSEGPAARLVLGGREHELRVLDGADARPVLQVPEQWVPMAALTPDGRTLVFQSGYVLRTLDVSTGGEIERRDLAVDGGDTELRNLRTSPDGARAMVIRSAFFRTGGAGDASDRRRYDLISWDIGQQAPGRIAGIEAPGGCLFEIAPGLDRVVAMHERGSLTLFDGSSGRRVAELMASSGEGWAVSAFSRDGAFVSGVRTTAEGPAACLWRASDGALVWSAGLNGLNGGVTRIGFSHDGRLIGGTTWAAQGRGGTVFVLDAADGKLLWRAENPGVSMDAVAFTPDGSRLLTCRSGDPAGIDVWDTRDGRRLLSLPYWLAHGSSNDAARPGFATTDECLLVLKPDNSHAVLSSRRTRDRAAP